MKKNISFQKNDPLLVEDAALQRVRPGAGARTEDRRGLLSQSESRIESVVKSLWECRGVMRTACGLVRMRVLPLRPNVCMLLQNKQPNLAGYGAPKIAAKIDEVVLSFFTGLWSLGFLLFALFSFLFSLSLRASMWVCATLRVLAAC